MIQFQKVSVSSNIDEVGYDDATGEMHVRFRGRRTVYVYPGVTKETYAECLTSPSVGSFFHNNVKLVVHKELVRKVEPVEGVSDAVDQARDIPGL